MGCIVWEKPLWQKQSLKRLQDVHPNLLCIYMNLNIFNTNSENRFNSFLEAIIIELEELLEEVG